MAGDVIHPLNTMFFGPSVYKTVMKISPIVRLGSYGGAMFA